MNKFINAAHKERYINMVLEDNMSLSDRERASLFYIISGNEDLYKKRRYIYNPTEHSIKSCIGNREVDFSSGMRSLIRLGFNLYNSWSDKYTTPLDLFCNLDEKSLMLAGNALMIRFNEDFYEDLMD
jgi:hypothetical protein